MLKLAYDKFTNISEARDQASHRGLVGDSRVSSSHCQVLIADDDPGVRKALSRAVERAGYKVLLASDVSEAIEMANEHQPRLAIVDLHMPEGSGLDVIRSLRKTLSELHITILSGDPSMEARVDSFDVGADDYVSKPVFMPELVRRLLAAEREQDDRRALALEKLRAEQLYIYAKEMASFLAHDLNNGFCVALGNLEYLSLQEDIDEDCKSALKATLWVLNRMSVLTDNFLDIERLEEGALTPRRVMVPLHKLVSDVLALNNTRQSDNVTTQVNCDPDLQVFVDGPLLERVMHNIVGNAMRYVHDSGSITVDAHVRQVDGSDRLTISITNTGPVIPLAVCKSLFEKLERARDGKSRHGLGLYFCRLVCEAHGGTVGVTSEGGVTTFTLEVSCV